VKTILGVFEGLMANLRALGKKAQFRVVFGRRWWSVVAANGPGRGIVREGHMGYGFLGWAIFFF